MQEKGNTNNQKLDSQQYDYIFCGVGASASLLLMQLHQNDLLLNKRILLIDPDAKEKRDKTFCFWADAKDPISSDLETIISHKWKQVSLTGDTIQSIEPYSYNHVSSIDLYSAIHRLTEHYGWDKINEPVNQIYTDNEGPFIPLNGRKIRANYIFDSRPPVFKNAKIGESHIYQSFIGWMIETEDEIKNPTAFRFMDFEIDQQNSTQFVYVLPFSAHTALVEVTRFGAEIIGAAEADSLLMEYVTKHFGNYSIQGTEAGCIPMSNTEIESANLLGVVNLGARNHQIKPSTGYAFKNMYNNARALVEKIKQNHPIENLSRENITERKGRYSFYDALLLDILSCKPQQGKRIFNALLKGVETRTILKFLDEKTSIVTDLSIFKKLPWGIFLSTLFKRCALSSIIRPVALTLLTLVFILLPHQSAINSTLSTGFICLGMVAVGIPHGAVDHLLETGTWDVKIAPLFVLKYLMLGAFMGLLWHFLPKLALALFLGYSAWHFGQADGVKWKLSIPISFLWGATVLVYILGTHATETHQILALMGGFKWMLACNALILLPWFILALFRKNMSFAITLIWLSLTAKLPLLTSFALYFIGQHSITAWNDIKKHLNIKNRQLWLKSIHFHAAAWVLFLLFVLVWIPSYPKQEENLWAIFFIFISCISFPHAFYMNILYSKNKKKIG
jgi:lycopene beta-cyclase